MEDLLSNVWFHVAPLAYRKNPQYQSTWAKKWKHPASAFGQRTLSLIKKKFDPHGYSVNSEYNKTFCGVDILNELLENKELILDGEMNLIVSDGLSIDDLSHGELRLINIIISIHMSLLRSRGESIVILIDEPEVGLHLRWQSKLMDALGNLLRVHNTQLLNCRIILASHSPEIVGSYPHLSTPICPEGIE